MPMTEEYRKAMAESEDGGPDGDFEPLPEGYYLCKMQSAKESEKAGASGFTYYTVVWVVQKPIKSAKRTLWDRISLSPKAAFKMRELFDATGYTYDSDIEELAEANEAAIIEIDHQPIDSGKKKGQMGENVIGVYPADDADLLKLVGK